MARIETNDEESNVSSLAREKGVRSLWFGLQKRTHFTSDPQYVWNVSSLLPYLRWSDESRVTSFDLKMTEVEFFEDYHYCIAIDVFGNVTKLRDYYCKDTRKVLCAEGKHSCLIF